MPPGTVTKLPSRTHGAEIAYRTLKMQRAACSWSVWTHVDEVRHITISAEKILPDSTLRVLVKF